MARPPWEVPDRDDRWDASRRSWDREQFERRRNEQFERHRRPELLAEPEPRSTNWFARGLIVIVIAAALVWLFLELGGSILSTKYSGF